MAVFFVSKCYDHVICLPPEEEDIADSNAFEAGIKEMFRRLRSANFRMWYIIWFDVRVRWGWLSHWVVSFAMCWA